MSGRNDASELLDEAVVVLEADYDFTLGDALVEDLQQVWRSARAFRAAWSTGDVDDCRHRALTLIAAVHRAATHEQELHNTVQGMLGAIERIPLFSPLPPPLSCRSTAAAEGDAS